MALSTRLRSPAHTCHTSYCRKCATINSSFMSQFSLGAVLVCSILVASTIHMAASNSDGAPKEACDHLKPRHGGGVAQGQTPKTISLTITSTNSPNGTVANYTPGELYTGQWSVIGLHKSTLCTVLHSTVAIHMQYKANSNLLYNFMYYYHFGAKVYNNGFGGTRPSIMIEHTCMINLHYLIGRTVRNK